MADSARRRPTGYAVLAAEHRGRQDAGGLFHQIITWRARAAVKDACRVRAQLWTWRLWMLRSYNRHIEVDPEHNGNLFFWHYQNRHIANKQRTVLWLNGGPGCSSMDGALMEIGPYRVIGDGKLGYNNGSWDEFANLLFVDQPVGTGFSYVNTDSYLSELDQMADHMIIFLEKWFALFPEYELDDVS